MTDVSLRPPWQILLVDNDQNSHSQIRRLLTDVIFQGRSLTLISAFSAAEAETILRRTKSIALCLLDTALDANHTGLSLVQLIRQDLANYSMRILLWTKDQEAPPETDILLRYDITDTKTKTDFTRTTPITSLISALRSYQHIVELDRNRKTLATLNRQLEQKTSAQTAASISAWTAPDFPGTDLCWRTVLDTAAHPIVISRLGDGLVRYANQRAQTLFGDQLIIGQQTPPYFTDPRDADIIDRQLRHAGCVEDHELLLCRPDGRQFWALLSSVRMDFGGETCQVTSFNDITRRKVREEDLLQQATEDPLTGAVNRRYFADVGSRELRRARRFCHTLCVVSIDLDHFKRINDTFGHPAGDAVLKNTVRAFHAQLRDTDVLGRMGGEEFAILLPETNLTGALSTAERLREGLEQTDHHIVGLDKVTASLGIAELGPSDTSLETILARADEALYTAKRTGRNRVSVAGPAKKDRPHRKAAPTKDHPATAERPAHMARTSRRRDPS